MTEVIMHRKLKLRKESSRLIDEYKIYRLLNKRGFKSGQGCALYL